MSNVTSESKKTTTNRKFAVDCSVRNFNSKRRRRTSVDSSVGMLPPKRLRWKNRWKIRLLVGPVAVASVILVLFGVTHGQEFGGESHPDRDFEHIATAESKEIITNHISTSENGAGDDDVRYQYENVPTDPAGGHFTEISGDVVLGEKILRASESPYMLRTDLEVERKARLIVEPGVTIHFAPMVGITVRGSLLALVS